MKERFKTIISFGKDLFKSYSSHDASTMGAALSYYTVFSLAPVLLIVIAVAGLAFGQKAVSGEIFEQAKSMLGDKPAMELQDMIKSSYSPGKDFMATGVSIVLLLVGATSIMSQVQVSLNTIWEVKPKPSAGMLKYVRDRILSFMFILSVGFLMLVSLTLSAAMTGLWNYLLNFLPHFSMYLFSALELVVSTLIIAVLFAMMYKFIPDAKITWKEVRAGALATAILFTVGKYAIGIYLGKANVASAFGAAGSLIVIFTWVFYSSQILFIGAEYTKVYACRHGHVIEPSDYAVKVKTIDIEQTDEESHHEFERRAAKHTEAVKAAESGNEVASKSQKANGIWPESKG